MEFKIAFDKLVDFPYQKEFDDMFLFDSSQISDAVCHISNGNPSCYLVSGYRGAGKSSFLRRLEREFKESKTQKSDDRVLFVHTSFAKYDNQSYLIRKLIRELFLKINEIDNIKNDFEDLYNEISLLYLRTFNDVSLSHTDAKVYESQFSLSLSNDTTQKIVNIFPPALLLILQFTLPEYEMFSKVILFLWLLLSIASFTLSLNWSRKKEKELFIKTFYDDEIADHHFFSVVKKIGQARYKLVFVLDELDKVSDEDIDKLISEMKPYLVSGVATFLIVSGQRLSYKYYDLQYADDSILSSLFSKVIHVPLSTPAALRKLFYDKYLATPSNLTELESAKLKELVDYFIVKSRLIPRSFVSYIRQNLVHRDGQAYLTDTNVERNSELCSKVVELISEIEEKGILLDSHPRAIRDYATMSLYIEASKKLFNSEK